LQYTPRLALMEDHSLVLEVEGSLVLFGGPRALCRHIRASLDSIGLPACLGMAPSALGACLLARRRGPAPRRVLRIDSLRRLLDALPVHSLQAAGPSLDWLQAMGCYSLGQLAALPPAGLMQRSSQALGQALEAAYGRRPMMFDWFQAPDVFSIRHEADFHVRSREGLLAMAGRLLDVLSAWLQDRQWATDRLEFFLHHERGRRAQAPGQLILRLSEPEWERARFLGLLDEQLRHHRLAAPVVAMSLYCDSGQARHGTSGRLFPDPGQLPRKERQLLDQLCARLGSGQVLRPQVMDSHLPEQANQWVPALDEGLRATRRSPSPLVRSEGRPFWLLDPPLQLEIRQNRPAYRTHVLQLIRGPERLESGWWLDQGQQQRDYFMAVDRHRRCYWIYRLRGVDEPAWFLHGLFA